MAFDLSVLSTGNLCELHEALNTDPDRVRGEVKALVLKRLDVAPVKRERKASAPKEGETSSSAAATGPRPPSLKEVVKGILSKHTEGLQLKEIVAEVDKMVKAGEYESKAKNLPAVVSQAVHSLRQESLINHDRESKKYSIATQAA